MNAESYTIYHATIDGVDYSAIARGRGQGSDRAEIHLNQNASTGDFTRVVIAEGGSVTYADRLDLTPSGRYSQPVAPSEFSKVPDAFIRLAAAVLADRPTPVPYDGSAERLQPRRLTL